jgi:hypothetical protein
MYTLLFGETVTTPDKTLYFLLHYDSSKHCTCPLNTFIQAFKFVNPFLKRPIYGRNSSHAAARKYDWHATTSSDSLYINTMNRAARCSCRDLGSYSRNYQFESQTLWLFSFSRPLQASAWHLIMTDVFIDISHLIICKSSYQSTLYILAADKRCKKTQTKLLPWRNTDFAAFQLEQEV